MKKYSQKPTLGSKILYAIAAIILTVLCRIFFRLKITTDEEVKKWKKSKDGFIILSAHPSEFDAVPLICSTFPRYTRFVVAYQQLFKGIQGAALRALKVIPKKQFISDLTSIKEMMKTVKDGHVLGMMPEGRVSLDGTQNPYEVSTIKLLKKLGAPVAVLQPHGSFFVKPSYNYKGIIFGKVTADLNNVFTAEETQSLSIEEMTERLNKALEYNEFEYAKGSGRKYGSKNKEYMKNVSNVLYLCPECKSLYTVQSDGRKVSCSCGMKTFINQEMFFEDSEAKYPASVADWNKLQLEYERSFWNNEESKEALTFKVRKTTMSFSNPGEFEEHGTGILTLSIEGLHYVDDEEELIVPLSQIPGVSADYMFGYIAYYKDDMLRRFYMEDVKYVARFVNSLMILKKSK